LGFATVAIARQPAEVAAFFRPPRHRVYLVDEPEQRLHPAVQRRAAAWLTASMSQWGAQCVTATHALAFIDLPGQPPVYEPYRTPDHPLEPNLSIIQPLDPAALTPYTEVAKAIGFDRGELLARWRAFLLTDPRTTAVLAELCGERLERSWIKLIAIDYLTKPPELTEISILAQLTSAPIILLLPTLSTTEIDRLRNTDAARCGTRASQHRPSSPTSYGTSSGPRSQQTHRSANDPGRVAAPARSSTEVRTARRIDRHHFEKAVNRLRPRPQVSTPSDRERRRPKPDAHQDVGNTAREHLLVVASKAPARNRPLAGRSRVPPAGLEPAIFCLKGRIGTRTARGSQEQAGRRRSFGGPERGKCGPAAA
jgi:hypothetical protein